MIEKEEGKCGKSGNCEGGAERVPLFIDPDGTVVSYT